MSFPTIVTCGTKAEILAQLAKTQESLIEFYKSVPADRWNSAGTPEGWSPARNAKHVASTYRFFGTWIGLPAWFLRLLGKPGPQKPVEELSPTNRPGIKDYGFYRPGKPVPDAERSRLLSLIEETGQRFQQKIESRSEEELDTLKGAFGGMSLRVFSLFVLKHNIHHTNVARLRLESEG